MSFPTDSKLLNRSRERLAKWCHRHGVKLRQSYARKGPQALQWVNRYAHARQYRRMRAPLRKLRTYLGRVVRDVERKVGEVPESLAQELELAKRLLAQKKSDKNKLYSLHAPEVECISKGKAHNPYDGHTLSVALAQVRRLTGAEVDEAFVDRGYRGHGECRTTVYVSGQKGGLNGARLKRSLRRRQAIEPVIGHLKSDGLLGRNYLKGRCGDTMNVMLCGAGHNLRLILRELRTFCLLLVWRPTGYATDCQTMTHSTRFKFFPFLT